jgi:hypothetical protein
MTRTGLIDGAVRYLTGCGITVVDRDWYHAEGIVDIAAEERGQFVIVRVLAHPGARQGVPGGIRGAGCAASPQSRRIFQPGQVGPRATKVRLGSLAVGQPTQFSNLVGSETRVTVLLTESLPLHS